MNLLPVTFGGATGAFSEARVLVDPGFGIGACFFRCFATGVVGAWVGRLSGGRSASRLICASRANCRGELAIGTFVEGAWSGKATADPVANKATAAPGIATFTMPGRTT
ncbi:hypothetical protein [Kribbella qitaiheensis]|uniref:hypothetical protein n=1 Tax=Kribbella qitaiheensis TaxID=1544730 RepID=UPI001FE7CA03|nr:hypothetical protein [Kribbella qitaiheensis]